MLYTSQGIVSLLLLFAFSCKMSIAEDCNANEVYVEFYLFKGEDVEDEQGWRLTCEQDIIWNVPVGTIVHTDRAYIREEACIPDFLTCNFTIWDSWGDGIYDPGYYALIYGATTVAVYDNEEPFKAKSYCFGPDCPDPPLEDDHCDLVYMALETDANPSETSFTIACNGTNVLEGSSYTVPYEQTDHEICVEKNSCCKFSIYDTGNDGLTSEFYNPSSGLNETGSVYLEWASNRIFSYDGSTGFEFGSLIVDFGTAC